MKTDQWREDAACKGLPIDIFFSKYQPSVFVKRLCKSCPVREDCLADALASEGQEKVGWITGFRGGKSAGQRQALLRKERKAICR